MIRFGIALATIGGAVLAIVTRSLPGDNYLHVTGQGGAILTVMACIAVGVGVTMACRGVIREGM